MTAKVSLIHLEPVHETMVAPLKKKSLTDGWPGDLNGEEVIRETIVTMHGVHFGETGTDDRTDKVSE